MYFQDQEDPLPTLIPIKKKKNQVAQDPEENNTRNILFKQSIASIVGKQKKGPELSKEQKKNEREVKPLGADKIQQFDRNFQNLHDLAGNKEKQKIKKNDKEKELQKSKFLIAEMMKKINAQNLSQELYPVTNQTIQQIVFEINKQIQELKAQAQRKENSLTLNPNNQHLRKELQTLRKSIDRCVTIAELYNQKINQRNKISILQRSIINLKQQNMNLKIKINRGIETIENHMHNLPCERQKELKQELSVSQNNLKKQKQMRQKLQSNITDIVLNFKRLYEQADTARLIVTKKLEEIQIKQKNLLQAHKLHAMNEDKSMENPQLDVFQLRKIKKNQLDNAINEHSPPTNIPKTIKKAVGNPILPKETIYSKEQGQFRGRQAKKISINPIHSSINSFSMEQQIKKMRNNQVTYTKTSTK